MTEWATLRDAYGNAAGIPALIAAWTRAQSEELMDDLWSRLCHQGTVYSASFEAIPLLVEACGLVAPTERRRNLMLIGAIWASNDRFGGAEPSAATEQLAAAIRHMIEACMDEVDVDAAEFVCLLQAAASFHGELFWGRHLDKLAEGEFPGVCPRCESDMFIAIGKYGHFASADDYVRDATAKRTPLAPISAHALPSDGAWLHEQAIRHGRNGIAHDLRHVYGAAVCPRCSEAISVMEAIRRWAE